MIRDAVAPVRFVALCAALLPAAVFAQTGATVSVLPFTNLSEEPGDAWIGAGIAETLMANLQGAPGFELVTLGQIGVTRVLSGVYQRIGGQIRISARLVEVVSGAVIRTARVDGAMDDLFRLQDRLAVELTGRSEIPASRIAATPPAARSSSEPIVADAGPAIDGPPPPLAPEVIRRDERGRATVRAINLDEGITVDGALDDAVYQTVPSFGGFIQMEPTAGAPATERTEAWVFFDDTNLYIAARLWDSVAESEWVVNEMRRDSPNLSQNEGVGILLDTFYDRRNGNFFTVSPIGGRADGQVTNERGYNPDWNPLWTVETGRFDGGWAFEAAFPFKSMRYRPGRSQVWGLQLRRRVRHKNETSYLTPLDPGLGQTAIFQVSRSATLVGLEAPQSRSPIEIKPYAIGDLSSDLTSRPAATNEAGGNVGIDLIKYGITQNLTANFTINTDFAQVEADEQQVNLTRFSLFFPEKREFFLENQGVFQFGTGGRFGRGGSADAPILLYSRRIGLSQGLEVPIVAGGRLTGRAGAFTLGLLNIQTDDEPTADALSTNFSVFRIKRDLLRRSSVGAILTNRSVSTSSPVPGSNQAYGLDVALAFYENLSMTGYWAQTKTTGIIGQDTSYGGNLYHNGDRWGVAAEHLFIDRNFSPEVGFLRRDDMRKSFGSFRFSPRPTALDAIRKVSWEGSYNYITDAAGSVETREAQGLFGIELENSDRFDATHLQTYDFLKQPFEIAHGIVIPVGGYDFHNTQVDYIFGPHRRLAGRLGLEHGSFYGGTKTTLTIGGRGGGGFRGGRIEVTPQLSLEPGISLNWVDLPQGDFATTLVTTRATYTMTPLMFGSALIQYNSATSAFSTNLRLRWEYQPGSELFIVYNEQRDTLVPDKYAELETRAFIIKVNRLFSF